MPKINVLKPFRFSQPAKDPRQLPIEKEYKVGEHDIDATMAAHPWIKGLADGCIESREAGKAREAKAKAKLQQENADAVNATAQANAAMDRLTRSQPGIVKAQELSAEDLNTPIGVLRARQDGVNAEA